MGILFFRRLQTPQSFLQSVDIRSLSVRIHPCHQSRARSFSTPTVLHLRVGNTLAVSPAPSSSRPTLLPDVSDRRHRHPHHFVLDTPLPVCLRKHFADQGSEGTARSTREDYKHMRPVHEDCDLNTRVGASSLMLNTCQRLFPGYGVSQRLRSRLPPFEYLRPHVITLALSDAAPTVEPNGV